MKKLIILLLCCGVLVSMVGCGGNTAPHPTESPTTTVSETIITETPIGTPQPTTAVEPTEKEKEPIPYRETTEPTVTTTETTTTTQPTKETVTTATSTAKEKVTPLSEEVPSIITPTPQLMEKETTETEPPKEEPKTETEPLNVTEPESTENPAPFDISHCIAYARSYAKSKGLVLSDTVVDCLDNPIRTGAHCIYLLRDIQSRLERYTREEDITDVWIWIEVAGDGCYDIYIDYA